ncbi:MAG TPA: DUF2600 family protein [Solirubrobacterales bacterium]
MEEGNGHEPGEFSGQSAQRITFALAHLTWWEYTAGGTASILCVHALIAAAADDRVTATTAASIDRAYLYTLRRSAPCSTASST